MQSKIVVKGWSVYRNLGEGIEAEATIESSRNNLIKLEGRWSRSSDKKVFWKNVLQIITVDGNFTVWLTYKRNGETLNARVDLKPNPKTKVYLTVNDGLERLKLELYGVEVERYLADDTEIFNVVKGWRHGFLED